MTRRKVRWRRTARSDLLHLARWIAQDNPDAAHRLLDAAREAVDMLADLPKLAPPGRFRSRGLAHIRIWPIRGFEEILIIYAAERTGIDVLRVVHGARDLDVLEARCAVTTGRPSIRPRCGGRYAARRRQRTR